MSKTKTVNRSFDKNTEINDKDLMLINQLNPQSIQSILNDKEKESNISQEELEQHNDNSLLQTI